MVIGGGPGGMESARIAALRGHEVALYEKEQVLGGQVRWAAKPLYRGEYEQVIRYLSTQIKKAGVQINLDQAVDKELVYAQQPDVVVVATGATPYRTIIPGRDKPHVYTYLDILSGSVKPGKRWRLSAGKK